MIGIIGPSENEINPFIDTLENLKTCSIAKLKFHCGDYNGIPVVAVFSGVCKVNAAIATQLLISHFKTNLIILTGVAGSLDESVQVGDIVIPLEVAYHDVAEEILTQYHPWMESVWFCIDKSLIDLCVLIESEKNFSHKIHFGKTVTGEKFVTSHERNDIIKRFSPLCVDMESASVAHVCFANSTKLLIVRSITDHTGNDGHNDFEENVVDCSLLSVNFVKEFLKLVKKLNAFEKD